jgi:NAD+ diphosphatase
MLKPLITPKISAQVGLRRRGEKRTDRAFIATAKANPEAKLLALFDLKVPILATADRSTACIRWLTVAEARNIAELRELVFLGEDEAGRPIFAGNFQPFQFEAEISLLDAFQPLVDLRSLAVQGVLSEDELLLASQARAILGWHASNRCCIRCGSLIHSADAGWRRHCDACGLDAYPRTDPAVIMLIARGDRCLLGHEHRFPDKFYSTLAGFVEAGDDIEHAVRREVKEEAGIDVGAVHYVGSQPWPFPHSLMIGCWGEALNDEIVLDITEIADARWFTRDETASMLAHKHPDGLFVPPPISMAHTLIRGFVDGVLGG